MKSVVERLRYDPFSEDTSRLVVGSVTHTRGRYVIALQMVDGAESFPPRQLESSIDDCSAVTQAAALSIAVDIEAAEGTGGDDAGNEPAFAKGSSDAAADARALDDGRNIEPARATASDAGEAPRAALTAEAEEPRPRRVGASASVGGAIAAGLLPRVAAGVDVAGVVHFSGPVSVSVGMSYFPEVQAADPNFALGSTLVRGGACLDLFSWRNSGVTGCAHAVVGSTTLIVQTLQPIKPGSRLFVAPALGLRFSQSLGPLMLTLGGDVTTPFPRYQFDVLGTGRTIFAAPVAAAVAYGELGVGFR
jgi:hypothetical protein